MKKILYAEDNDGMRKMVSHFLSNVGFEVIALSDGDEAVEVARNEVFDAILLDVTMLRLDGHLAAMQIRNNCPKNKITPIVGLTARTEPKEIKNCYENGMDIILSKPVDLEKLAKTLIHDIKSASNELRKSHQNASNFTPKILDVEVLKNYAKIAGAQSLEGILHDFSDLWPRKIGEL
ncbi:MAG: response regulator [Caulobacterales bacterium]|nr:response regulator [Caulobacterales bacterium]